MDFKEISKITSETLSSLKEAYKGNPKMEKKVAIAENLIHMTQTVADIAQLSSRRKRIFQPINRMPKGRIERKKKIFNKMVALHIGRMRHELILQTPIPKFPKGTRGSGIVGEKGEEIIKLGTW